MSDNDQSEIASAPGGQGELLVEAHQQRSDVAMIERAVRREWDIPEAAMRTLPAAMLKIAHNVGKDGKAGTGNVNESGQIKATRVVAMMHGQNLSDEQANALPRVDLPARRQSP